MSQQVELSLVREDDYVDPTGDEIVSRIELIDRELAGHDAVFSIIAKVEVKDKHEVDHRPVGRL